VSERRSYLSRSPQGTWPTYLHDPRDTIVADNWNGVWNEPRETFDLNNDGRIDRPVEAFGFGGMGANFGFWALPPAGLDEAERTRVAGALSMSWFEESLPQLRRDGWVFYTGADTRFHEIQWVYLYIILRDAETYLLAHQRGVRTEVLLRPMPDGQLREVCVYERAPDL
jgi:hypothetical protein